MVNVFLDTHDINYMTDNEIKNYITEKYNYFEMEISIAPTSHCREFFNSVMNVKILMH